MRQKDIFLCSEGDAWFSRNRQATSSRKLPDDDILIQEILSIPMQMHGAKLLEIGCGDGTRLEWMRDNLGVNCWGVDPSAQAVSAGKARGLKIRQGTADDLPFDDGSFDIVIFGFCLYLCDREDLFRIANAADRVLRMPGWLLILDFFSSNSYSNNYHHCPEVLSYKMDYRSLFTWHPNYECLTHKVRHHHNLIYTDDKGEWISVSVLRKFHEP